MYISGDKTDRGLFFLRLGFGLIFIVHGFTKLTGGADTWEATGSVVQYIGIDLFHNAFGFAAAIGEIAGGLSLIVGIYMIPALALLIAIIFFAVISQIASGSSFPQIAYPLSTGIVLISLLFTGPGTISADYKRMRSARRRRRIRQH